MAEQQGGRERRPSLSARSKSAIILSLVLVACVGVYLAKHPAATSKPGLRQLTHVGSVLPGFSLSRDGRIVAFASDAAEEGNFDIWVQRTDGARARRLTHDPAADIDPDLSPDGKKLLFVSRRTPGGGIYQISAEGEQETLLIPNGEEPRYSPDGKWIAYLSDSQSHRLHVSDYHGGNIRQIATPLAWPDHPIWSPDGRYLMVYGAGTPGFPADWWVIPISGEKCIATQVLHDLTPYFSSGLRENFYARAWLPGEQVLFAGDQDGAWSIWRIRLSAGNFRVKGRPEAVTPAQTGVQVGVAGNRLAFVKAAPEGPQLGSDLWRLPVDTARGQMTGIPRRITRGGNSVSPSLSADGRILAYASVRRTDISTLSPGIYARDMETGEDVVIVSSSERKGYVALSRDGSKIAYGTVVPGLKRPIYVYDRASRVTRKLCDDCEGRPVSWSPDGANLIVSAPQKGIRLINISTGERSFILPGAYAVFSPDGRWLAVATGSVGHGSRVAIVPFRGRVQVSQSEWITVGDAASVSLFPAWSPGGELLYFISTPYFNALYSILQAQRFHPDSGMLQGQPFTVYRFEQPFLPLLSLPLNNRLAISPGQIVVASQGTEGDIWITDLKPGNLRSLVPVRN